MNAPAQVPAFDPDSPDAAMLDAFERVRALQRSHLEHDRLDSWPDKATADAASDRVAGIEDAVTSHIASTVSGVVARLSVLSCHLDGAGWVEKAVAEHGLLALPSDPSKLDWKVQQARAAAAELIAIAWQQALGAYEQSAADFEFVLDLKELVDCTPLPEPGGKFAAFRSKVETFAEEAERRFTNSTQVRSLIRTLVPDRAAYLRKAEIVLAEGCEADAAQWLVRDALFLLGGGQRDIPALREADA
uniref:hypothetical protein n=1 Tax=uncultured Sphingomonas sp. TaxID=158754 RepID=UPI0035CBF21E